MNRTVTLLSIILFHIGLLNAQSPQAFKYQTTVRDNSGLLMANKLVAFRIGILSGSTTAIPIYTERHGISTNDFGIANLNIGQGVALQGIFNSIDWSNGPFFLKIEIDANNGTNYSFMGTSQLLSVPFALYAAKSGNAADDADKDSVNELQTLSISGDALKISKGNQVVVDVDSTNEIQALAVQGNKLSISKANTVTIDADSANELQQLTIINHTLNLNKGGGNIDMRTYARDSQQLVLQGNTLSITNGNSIVLSGTVDLDSDPTNEIQRLVQTDNTLSLIRDTAVVYVPKTSNVVNGSLLYATATGTDTINLTLNTPVSGYVTGMIVNFKVQNTNTKNVMVRVNNLPPKHLYKNINNALAANDLKTNQMASIIYDGQNFQFFVVPYSSEAGNAFKLKNDTAGGLVSVGSYIESESPNPTSGFASTGKVRSEELEVTIINSDSAYRLVYLGLFNTNHIFYSARQIQGTNYLFTFSRYDSLLNSFTHLRSEIIIVQENYFQVKLLSGKVYIISIIGVNVSNNRIVTLYSYDIGTNQFQNLYNFSFSVPSTTEGSNIYNRIGLINNSLIFRMWLTSPNVYLGNTSNSYDVYRWNLSNGVVSRIFEMNSGWNLEVSTHTDYYIVRNDSLYRLNTNFTWSYRNKFGSSNKSNISSLVNVGSLIYHKDYIYNISTNAITNRNNTVFLIGGFNLNGKLFASNASSAPAAGGIQFDKLFLSDLAVNTPVTIPINSMNMGQISPSNLNAEGLIYYNEDYVWATGNGIVYRIKIPKLLYQYKKI